jgi:hypothetical protein
MTKIDDMLSAAALRLRDFGSSSGFTEQQLLAGLTVPATSDPIARRVDQRRLEIVDRHIRELLPVAGLILGNAEFPSARPLPRGCWPTGCRGHRRVTGAKPRAVKVVRCAV